VTSQSRITERYTVRNPTDRTLTLILEPWANEYDLPAGTQLIVEGEGPCQEAGFHVIQEGDVVAVWAWSGADARILDPQGQVVADWTGLRMPEVPRKK
jgi:hypothetical protein